MTYAVSFALGIAPDPYINLVDWNNKHRYLPKESSVEPGKYRTSRTPYVEEILLELSPQSPTQEVVFVKPTQIGAPLAIDTPIPTPSGWTDMGDIEPRDMVFNESGMPCRVSGVSEIFWGRVCKKIVFSDGSSVVCDNAHLWSVIDSRNYKILKNRTITTEEISETLHDVYSKNPRVNRYAIPVQGHLKTRKKRLLISPYALGCWLGDGSNASATITQGVADAREMCEHIADSGHPSTVDSRGGYKGAATAILVGRRSRTHCKRGHDHEVHGVYAGGACKECHRQRGANRGMDPVTEVTFHSLLSRLKLLKNKHIPARYLRASYPQRLELLQGLMDSDGSALKNGRQEFSNHDAGLIDQVYELLVSIGIKVSITETPARTGVKMPHGGMSNTKNGYRLSFYAQTDKPVFKLRRKLARMKNSSDVTRLTEINRRRIVSVELHPTVPVRCIAVESESHLFLCGRAMIPTHNTEIANNFLFCTAKRYPGPSMMAFPTDKMAMKHSKKKLATSVAAMHILQDVIKPAKSRDSGNTLLLKEFPGGSWTLTGSNSPASARSDSIRYLIRDDYAGFLKDTGDEGFIGDLLKNRTDAFGSKRKIYTNSTPTLKDTCNMWPEWEESSQGHFYVPCPRCGHMQFLVFGDGDVDHGIKFTRDETGFITDVRYVCKKCHGRIEEYEKTGMMAKGEYVHTYPERLKRGFKINGLYSPLGWFSWWNFATEFISAVAKQKRGDSRAIRHWTNTRKADFYEEKGEQPDWTRLSSRGEPYKQLTVPEKGSLVCSGVDTHDDRLDVKVKAYGVGEESWLLYWGSIYGDPDLPAVWQQLDEILYRPWPHTSGVDLHIQAMAIDSGGHKTQAVYKYARARRGLVMAIKGSSTKNSPIISAPKKIDIDIGGQKIKKGVELWSIGTDQAKIMVYNRLRLTDPGPGFCHFPLDMPDEYYKQLTAEKLVKRFVKGYQVEDWVNTRTANHGLDCEVYALVAAIRLGVQTMDWVKLAKKFKVAPPAQEDLEKAQPPAVVKPTAPRKKQSRKAHGGYKRPAWM